MGHTSYIAFGICTALVVSIGFTGCSRAPAYESDASAIDTGSEIPPPQPVIPDIPTSRINATADDAVDTARANLDGQTYQDVMGTADCTMDCSGHDAGFQWAQDNGIESPDDCDGNSESFIEGCRSYGEALADEADTTTDDLNDDQ